MSGKFSKKMVITSYVLVITFTIICLIYQFIARDTISETLITWFYSFVGVELIALAGIKGVKIIRNPSLGLSDIESAIKNTIKMFYSDKSDESSSETETETETEVADVEEDNVEENSTGGEG